MTLANVLDEMERRPTATMAGILVYLALTIPTHDLVQLLFGAYRDAVGLRPYHLSVLLAAAAIGAAVAWPVLRGGGLRLWREWSFVAALTVGAYILCIAVSSEVVHFFQYAILAVPLYALTRCALDTVAIAAILGAIDEGYQFLVLNPTWAIYFDYNDVLIDAIGAGLGVLWLLSALDYGATSRGKGVIRVAAHTIVRSPAVWAMVAIAITVVILLGAGIFVVDGLEHDAGFYMALNRDEVRESFWVDEHWAGKPFHVLRPIPGTALILLSILPFAALGVQGQGTSGRGRRNRVAVAAMALSLWVVAAVVFPPVGERVAESQIARDG